MFQASNDDVGCDSIAVIITEFKRPVFALNYAGA
jgi:hypothetical protein